MSHRLVPMVALALALIAQACSDAAPRRSTGKTAGPGPGPDAASATSVPADAGAPPAPVQRTRFHVTPPGRVVAIGDLHGDLDAALRVLRLAGAVDAAGRWSGGNLTVVQTGDQIDRGDDDRAVLDLFDRLRDEAPRQGGQVIPMAGNHEHMNVEAKLSNVTRAGYRGFDEFATLPGAPVFVSRTTRGRYLAFRPGGPYALRIAKRPLVVVVGTTVFVHGGLLPEHVRRGIERINDEAAAWVRGEVRDRPRFLKKDHSPLWSRRYSAGTPTRPDCERLHASLGPLGARRMVMGHTVQPTGINAACGGRVWRIDVGLSKPYRLGITQALEIDGEAVRVLDAGKGATAR